LKQLERGVRGGKLSETDQVPSGLTVEHLMPQSWEEHWPLPADVPTDAAIARRRLLHTIGNLTLLSEKLNASVSNGPWAASNGATGKRKAIEEHTVLHLNKELCNSELWTEGEIEQRSEILFAIARSLWPRPTASEASLAA
jgi:Protein of unknown function (DUF1524)